MPWSEWLQQPDYTQGFLNQYRLAINQQIDYLTGTNTTTGTPGPSVGAAGASRSISSAGVYDSATVDGRQYTVAPFWETDRDWFPDPLYDLTEGVDYTVRPDRTGSEDDAYIQYEDGPNVRTGWNWIRAPKVTLAQGGSSWVVEMVNGTNYVAGDNPGGPPASGLVFATGDGSTPVDTVLPSIPTPTADTFAIFGRLTDNSVESAFEVQYPTPNILYRMPRWRYWVPGGPPPLRLRQRDDNLFLNAGRIRNRSSRQTTNRLRSYD